MSGRYNMEKQDIYNNLCSYDKRSPDYDEEDGEFRKPRDKCFCDNCFYGRDELALEILNIKPAQPLSGDTMHNNNLDYCSKETAKMVVDTLHNNIVSSATKHMIKVGLKRDCVDIQK